MKSILLLAGLSRRCGDENKLIKSFGSSPLFSYSLTACLKNTDTIIVTGHQSGMVEKAVREYISTQDFEYKYEFVYNPRYKEGQFSSIAAGLDALKPCDDFCIVLGDTPFLTPELFYKLKESFLSMKNKFDALRAYDEEKPLHPVFFSSRVKDDIKKAFASGFERLQDFLQQSQIRMKKVQFDSKSLGFDVDFLEDFV